MDELWNGVEHCATYPTYGLAWCMLSLFPCIKGIVTSVNVVTREALVCSVYLVSYMVES